MKYFLLFLVGLVLGALLSAAVLWFNPLTAEPRSAPLLDHGVTAELHTSLRSEDAPLLTHGGERLLLTRPESVPELWEEMIRPMVASVQWLRDAEGTVIGTASRLGAYSRQTNPLRTGFIVESTWLLSVDGAGMAFAVQRENVWPVFKDVVLPALLRRQSWQGDLRFTPAAGPRPDRAGRLLGISGQFADAEGQLVSTYRVSAFDPQVGPTGLEWYSVLSLPQAEGPVAAE